MKHLFFVAALYATLSTQANAWGLGDIGAKVLQSTVNNAVNGKNSETIKNDAAQTAADEVNQQAQANADANAVDPNTLEGAATNIAADAASNAASDALSKSGVPGAAVIGGAAGSLVKGFGGMFKKKQATEEQQPATTDK